MFAEIFEFAKELTENVTLHAGEEDGPISIMDALFRTNCKRIDHGIRALEDPFLCRFLKEYKIPLATSPLSNKLLKVYDRFFPGR